MSIGTLGVGFLPRAEREAPGPGRLGAARAGPRPSATFPSSSSAWRPSRRVSTPPAMSATPTRTSVMVRS